MSTKHDARSAAAWYLAMIVTGAIGILYVPMQIVDRGVANLAAHGDLVRAGILTSIACQVSFLFLGLALCRLFAGVDERQARLLMTLVTAAAPIAIVNELFDVAALMLAPSQPDLAITAFALRQTGVALAGFFWGLWLVPLGRLVIRSGFAPKLVGVLLLAGGAGYIADSTLGLLVPALRADLSMFLLLPLAIGELAMVGWLLVHGLRTKVVARAPHRAASPAG